MLLFEALMLAVFESLLPNGSSQFGPPLCFNTLNKLSNDVNKKYLTLLRSMIQFKRSLEAFLLLDSF